jgi:hypothetical protein
MSVSARSCVSRRLAVVLAAFLALVGTACGGAGAGPDVPDALVADAPADVHGDADVPADPFRFEVTSHTLPDGLTGIATAAFTTLSHEFAPIPVDPKYTHVLNWQMTAFLPPYRVAMWTWGPVVLYSDDLDVLVFSPMDHFFGSIMMFEGGQIRHGLHGDVASVPAGFTQRFLKVEGRGINATMEAWGERMRQDHGRARTDRYADAGLSTLGYWTDNGAYYYYRTEDGKTFEDTLLDVKAEADTLGIPYGHLQIDSWWYPKRPGKVPGANGGTITWEPKPEVFPEGLASFRQRLGLSLVAHNRWYAPDTPYRDRFTFQDGDEMSFPTDRKMFEELMGHCVDWGIETYEQDWFSAQWWGVPWLRADVDRGEDFVANIAIPAAARGVTVQMCMAEASHLMSALDHPNVTTIRTSNDYAVSLSKESYWPQFHTAGMLAWAVGVLPFKDNFQSDERVGQAEALIAALSAGIVAVGDGLGRMKTEYVLATCRADGLLLKPDRPATPTDTMFFEHRRPYLTSTYSDRSGLGRWTYFAAYLIASEHPERTDDDRLWSMFAFETDDAVGQTFYFPETVDDWHVDLAADLGIADRRVAYDWRTGQARVVEGRFDLPAIQHEYDFAYLVLAPVLANGLALIGETGKYVTVADRRFTDVTVEADAIRVTLSGKVGEDVTVRAFDATAGALLPAVTVTIGAGGTAVAVLSR